jgi:leader peptidase (prepilin peptidase)/N-methyltransferase
LLDGVLGDSAAEWVVLLIAPFVGSFLGVVVRRLPDGRPLASGRSRCEWCATALQPRDLVPFLSWLVGKGRCRFCGHPLGWFYPGIEAAALALALIAVMADRGGAVWLDCLLGWWLLALGWIDLRRWLLPDAMTLPLVILGLAEAAVFEPVLLAERAAGAAFGYLALRAIAVLYRRLRGREGVGGGDAKLLAASGAWVGVAALPQVILVAALGALAAAACLRLAGVRLSAQSALPFGPFLAIATWLSWLFGPFGAV